MIKLKNRHNNVFLNSYLKDRTKMTFETLDVNTHNSYTLFDSELHKLPENNLPVILGELAAGYSLKKDIEHLLPQYRFDFKESKGSDLSKKLQEYFDRLMVDVTHELLGCYKNEDDKIKFNKRSFADFILSICNLVINEKDPDTLLIYNKFKGRWEDAAVPINRLIIELAHYVGGDIQDTWNSHLEKGITDILIRKTKLMDPRRFNNGYFPLGNKALEFKTGEIVEHSPRHFATMGSSVIYDPAEECPVFERFIQEIFQDEATVQFVQEWFGYVLSGSHKANALLIGTGKGANGKSTLFEVLGQLVGVENVTSAPLTNFNSDFGLEPMIGMKLNLATESDVDSFKTGKLKALTAGEAVSINRKNKKEVTLVLPTKLVFLMNELPMLNDTSFGFERRLLILPFKRTFSAKEQDKDLPKKLNSELRGILNWSIVGLKRLIRNDFHFTNSKPMKDSKEMYFGVGNPVDRFMKECIVSNPSRILESKDIFHAYNTWMMTKKYPFKGTDSPQLFWRMFKEAADVQLIQFKKSKSNGKTVVRDIDLKIEV